MTIMVILMMAICAPVMLISDDFLVGPDEDLDEDLDEPDDYLDEPDDHLDEDLDEPDDHLDEPDDHLDEDLDEPDEPDDDLDEADNHLDEGRSDLSLLIDVRESGLLNR